MRAELDTLRSQQPRPGVVNEEPPTPGLVSRRQWMKTAAAVAVGGTAMALGQSERAAAANGDQLLIGNLGTPGAPQTATSPTQINYTGTEDMGFVVQSGSSFTATSSSFDAALGGWTSRAVNPIGVYGFANNSVGANGKGVLGRSDSSGSVGVEGQGSGTNSDGVRGSSGSSGTGVRATGGTGLHATGSVHGASIQGSRAALLLAPSSTVPPALRGGTHTAGEIEGNVAPDGSGTDELWVCVVSGAPGTWRRLAGPGTAGSLTAINPVRVYDSRSAAPTPGVISAGADRLVSVADGRDTGNGSVITPDAVPAGATAVAFNLTIADTSGLGFLSITPGDATSSPASTINWAANGLALANAGIVKLDADRNVKVFCGGAGATNFIIDITGYYL